MSQWTDSFLNSEFHDLLKDYSQAIEELDESIVDDEYLTGLARLKAVIVYLGVLIDLIDPELNKKDSLTQATANIRNSRGALDHLITTQNNVHWNNIHTNIDKCVDELKKLQTPLTTAPKRAVSSIVNAYQSTVEAALSEIQLDATKAASTEIADLKEKLIDNDESVEFTIDNLVDDLEEKQKQISDLHSKLLSDTSDSPSVKSEITGYREYIKEVRQDARKASTEISELRAFYTEIYGEPEKEVIGLREELENRTEELDKLKTEHIAKFKTLETQIKDLLPGATNAGLASAYSAEREKFTRPIWVWTSVFFLSIGVMLFITFIGFFEAPEAEKSVVQEINKWHETLNQLLIRLPLYGPLAWLAIYASRRRAEQERLEQEYAHKETFARSYSSYKQQIDDLDGNDELMKHLLESSITTISHNASKKSDAKDSHETPLSEVIDSLSSIKKALGK